MIRVKLYLIIFLGFFCLQSFGQLNQTARFEIETKSTDEPFHVISAEEEGLFIFQDLEEFKDGKKQYELRKLDTNLDEIILKSIYLDDKFDWLGYEYSSPYLYLLFRTDDNPRSDLHVTRYNSFTDTMEDFEIKNELEFEINYFEICNQTGVMAGYVDDRPTLIIYNFDEEQFKILPGYYTEDSKLLDLTVNVNNTFNVLIYNEESKRIKSVELKVYDWRGNQLADDLYSVPEDKEIASGTTSHLNNEHLIVLGTYGARNSNQTEGFFFVRPDLGEDQEIEMIPYKKLSSILDYENDRRREKIREKIKEDASYVVKENIIINQLLEGDDVYYILADVFDPNYVNNLATAPNPYMTSRYRFNPYSYRLYRPNFYNRFGERELTDIDYIQSMVIAFNSNGSILWDKSIQYDNIEYDNLKQVAAMNTNNDELAVTYKADEEIAYKIFEEGETIVSDTTVNIMLKKENDILRDDEMQGSGVRSWYPANFYLWGYQDIKRNVEGSNERFKVFYINKLSM